MAIIVVRLIVLAAATGSGLAFGPSLGLSNRNVWLGAAGLLAGALAVLLEWQARSPDRLFWGAVGASWGGVRSLARPWARSCRERANSAAGIGALLAYLGAAVSLAKRDEPKAMSESFPARRRSADGQDPRHVGDHRRPHVSVCERIPRGASRRSAIRPARAAADRRFLRYPPAQPGRGLTSCSSSGRQGRYTSSPRLSGSARGG